MIITYARLSTYVWI